VVPDVNCYYGTCANATGKCSVSKKSNFNTAISSNGVSCLLRFDTAARAAAIGGGAAAGIAIGGAGALVALGWGGKKGYELYQSHFAVKDSAITDNPMYEESMNHANNPLFDSS